MGFFGPSQSKRAALDARHAAKLAEIQSKFAAEEAERARLDAEEEATYLRKLELLSRNALFDAMTEDDLDALAGVMRRVEVKAGKRVLRHEPKSERDRASKRGVVTSLFGAGKAKGKPAARAPPDDDAFDRDEAFYVVDSGSLDVSVADEGVAVTLHPGDAVGELDKLFLAPRDRSVTVVANVDAVLWAVRGERFDAREDSKPSSPRRRRREPRGTRSSSPSRSSPRRSRRSSARSSPRNSDRAVSNHTSPSRRKTKRRASVGC